MKSHVRQTLLFTMYFGALVLLDLCRQQYLYCLHCLCWLLPLLGSCCSGGWGAAAAGLLLLLFRLLLLLLLLLGAAAAVLLLVCCCSAREVCCDFALSILIDLIGGQSHQH